VPKIIGERCELVKLSHINRSGAAFLRQSVFTRPQSQTRDLAPLCKHKSENIRNRFARGWLCRNGMNEILPGSNRNSRISSDIIHFFNFDVNIEMEQFETMWAFEIRRDFWDNFRPGARTGSSVSML